MSTVNPQQQTALQEGQMLPVMEHFYTLQGEGAHTGLASYFIRIGGCDVGCHWCDVKESWDATRHPLTAIHDLAQTAAKYCKTIVLTGGEPTMWNLEPLTKQLHDLGCKIHIETSGAYPLTGHIDWICVSPKKTALPRPDILQKANELKCIIYNRHDFQFAEQYAAQVSPSCELYLQPEWSKSQQITPEIIEYILKNPKWKISLQTHKFLNIP
ncbi:MAG: 7-carboxy-7-deazaguanine synthase QueE [Weeksellaceae bacterium]|nr:7-carboxy-7-deazaguanine synthase QueE [Weeksellaceae bacterium]